MSDDQFQDFTPILDRILVRVIEEKAAEDGLSVPERFRQQSNWAEVVAVGQGVVLGGQFLPLSDFVNVGDRLRFGQYTAEDFSPEDPGKMYIIRLQDVRGVRRKNG